MQHSPKECSIAPLVTMAHYGSNSAVIFSKIGTCMLGEGERSKKKNPTNELLCLHFISSLSTGIGVRK